MTVHELIALLETQPQDIQVLLSSDAEGNTHGYVDDSFGKAVYFDGEQSQFAIVLMPYGRADV